MKVSSKKAKENKVVLDIEVPKETVKKKFDEVYEKISLEAKIPGYRPGKAPRQVLEQHHSALAREEVLKNLISETYHESVKKENIDVIDMPEISEVKLEGDVLSYKAEVEVKPEIKIKQYKGLPLKKNEIKIEAKEIEEYVKQLKSSRDAAMDDQRLARSLGYGTKEEFLDCLNKQLFLKKENEERAKLEKSLIEQLLKNASFAVPATLVEKRIHELEHQAQHQMQEYGLPEERIKERIKEFAPKFKTEAEEQVKVFLILEAVGKLENMKADDHLVNRVIEFLFAEAQWA
jgi:FKBP-type peptidyl-prolyl cis-trans isomerase (trigger factor)